MDKSPLVKFYDDVPIQLMKISGTVISTFS